MPTRTPSASKTEALKVSFQGFTQMDAAPEGERHCHTILVVLGGSAITGLGSRGASGWLRLMFEGRPGIDAKGAEQEPEKDSAEIDGLLRLCILERRQIRAAMRTKYRGNAHWLGAKWAVPHAASRHNHSHGLPRPKYIKTGHRSEGQ